MLAMFVAHAYDGWLEPAAKLGLGYRITREIAASALPSFLLLAGVAIGLRWASTAADARAALRRALVLRGLRLIAAGYALSLAYAWLDGGLGQPQVWLRADVLHAIGASVLALAVLTLPVRAAAADAALASPERDTVGRAALLRRACALGVIVVAACPLLTAVLADRLGALGYAFAPFVPIAGITRFAAVPLAGFACAGLALAMAAPRDPAATVRHGRTLTGLGLALAVAGAWATRGLLAWLGGTLGPSHPALLANALDCLGRALVVLGLGAMIPARASAALERLGRHSLLLYAVHIPFCYGRAGGAWHHRLDLQTATLAFALLAALAWLLCAAVELSASTSSDARSRARWPSAPA